MTRRLVMDDRPSSRGAPPTPPSSMAIVAAPSSADTPGPAPTPPLMLATMTPVNVDGYLYEHHPEHIPHSHHSHHPHQPPVIYSTASLTASLADHVPVGVPVGVPEDALMDGTVSVVYQQQVPSNTVVIMSELVDDMSPVLQLR
ncbi:hypothetical protein ONE63_010890 [Megalurothrips usitatus]|uniref:Uncharacterized protein n=1 Tax=Megalurothrips usitatus TaxID=439358 RepID=A0AAV7XHY9_9NEOP|nr:hypothetical protein ONE63_010890 [Megalurothrips usitatus]